MFTFSPYPAVGAESASVRRDDTLTKSLSSSARRAKADLRHGQAAGSACSLLRSRRVAGVTLAALASGMNSNGPASAHGGRAQAPAGHTSRLKRCCFAGAAGLVSALAFGAVGLPSPLPAFR